jgi:EAL domain-containing protein (putative c-di-GMP-specific phosphodiesterase class I)
VAEETGMIMEIGDWVLRSAVEAAATWYHGDWPEVRVAINVSPRQLFDIGFRDRVADLLQKHALPARCIEIELTESVLQTGSSTIESIQSLRSLGVSIALDDFGTGYSSLASLEKLPLSRLKIDRSLIADLGINRRAGTVIQGIVALCHGLGLEVTAEGIERIEQLQQLIAYGPIILQGYLIDKPVPYHQVKPLIHGMPQKLQLLLMEAAPMDFGARPFAEVVASAEIMGAEQSA